MLVDFLWEKKMEYISLEERILAECKDQNQEYLVKKGTKGLLGLFFALDASDLGNAMKQYLDSGNKSGNLKSILCVIPAVLKNGKVFDTEKTISSLKDISPNCLGEDLFDCVILFSILFDLFYGTSLNDTIDNLNCLSDECCKKINVAPLPKLNENAIRNSEWTYISLNALKDYMKMLETSDAFSIEFKDEVSKSISLFIEGVVLGNNTDKYAQVDKKYGETIKNYLLSL